MKNLLLSFLFICAISITAQTKLPSFFGNNMVLQQNEDVAIWGTDKPNTKIIIQPNWTEEIIVKTDKSGNWRATIKTLKADNKPYTLTIKGKETITLENILFGEVWFCSGQSNMAMTMNGYPNSPINGSNEAILNANKKNIRLFTVEKATSLTKKTNISGTWQESNPNTVANFSALAYFFADKLNSVINVPVGVINSSWGGSKIEAWISKQTLNSEFKDIKLLDSIDKRKENQQPTLLYNAMINPFIGFKMKGVLWYQGESNRINPDLYAEFLPAMIKSWRTVWQQGDFPFYIVQVAPYEYNTSTFSPFIVESQLKTVKTLKNTGLVGTTDLGDCSDIHPSEKKTIADRLAYLALAKNYGIEAIAFSGPVYKEMKITDNGKITITFDYAASGLSTYGKELTEFLIAGADKKFYPAKAIVNKRGEGITVWNDQVKNPVAVRYAFTSCSIGKLFNTRGLPAIPFRTDNWDDINREKVAFSGGTIY